MSYHNTILQHIICMCIKEHPRIKLVDICHKVVTEAEKNNIRCTKKGIQQILQFLIDTKSVRVDKGEYVWIKN